MTEAFVYMAGACGRCIIDNTSVIVANRSGPHATIAPEMKVFGQIFGTQFVPHAVGDANRKGIGNRNEAELQTRKKPPISVIDVGSGAEARAGPDRMKQRLPSSAHGASPAAETVAGPVI